MPFRFLPLAVLILIACSKDDTVTPREVLGTWRLTEVYIDPGDGSGTFRPADYERQITFFADSTYLTSAPLCGMNIPRGGATEGTYSPSETILFAPTCDFQTEYDYSLTDLEMTVTYFCDEGCAERYVKIRD